jgi:hypothetical protein
MSEKITVKHLQRKAVLYIRQPTTMFGLQTQVGLNWMRVKSIGGNVAIPEIGP